MGVYLNRKLEHLLNSNLIEKTSEKEQQNINGKGRIYNPSKPPSKILTQIVSSRFNKQFPK